MRVGSWCPSDCGGADLTLLLTEVAVVVDVDVVVAYKWQRQQQQQQHIQCRADSPTRFTAPAIRYVMCARLWPPTDVHSVTQNKRNPLEMFCCSCCLCCCHCFDSGVKESSKKSSNCSVISKACDCSWKAKQVVLSTYNFTGPYTHTTHTYINHVVCACANFTWVLIVVHDLTSKGHAFPTVSIRCTFLGTK